MTLFVRLTILATLAGLAGVPAGSAAQSPSAEGETLFRQRCAACHSLEAGDNGVGPHLAGLAGRRAGAVEGARYSASLREADFVWDASTLDEYLANPRQAVPGTTMPVGLPNESQRAAVIEFLLTDTGG